MATDLDHGSTRDLKLPEDPDILYSEWKGWEDFLGLLTEPTETTMTEPKPLYENSQWRVTDEFLETVNDKPVPYFIALADIAQNRPHHDDLYDWPLHMAEKDWVQVGSFWDAFRFALQHVGKLDEDKLARTYIEAQKIRRESR